MLREIRIQNLALIERMHVEFDQGLNVLTGETGAGKSILLDAIELLLGGRASSESVRAGAERLLVEGVFELLIPPPELVKLLEENGIELEDEMLIVCREIQANGRGICRVNGRAVALSVLRSLVGPLVDLHGQHEHQSLLQVDHHRELLDTFGGLPATTACGLVAEQYRRLQEIAREYQSLTSDEQGRARRLDLLRFQANEIQTAHPQTEEDVILEVERTRLASAEKIRDLAARAYSAMRGDMEERTSAVDLLFVAERCLKDLGRIDPTISETANLLESLSYQAEELAGVLRNYLEELVADPDRLSEIDDRLEMLGALKKKYGPSLLDVLEYAQKAIDEIEQLETVENRTATLVGTLQKETERYDHLAKELHEIRVGAAQRMQMEIASQLEGLQMKGTLFVVSFEDISPERSVLGTDRIEFLFSANPGEPPRPLSKIISGGEMSRVMLAVKTILAEGDQVPTMVFDEVDAGIGGRALQAVAEKLGDIGQRAQVICVTHAPQIAAKAIRHFALEKHSEDGRTYTQIALLDRVQRVNEVARMLGGATVTEITRQHADEMIGLAERVLK